jgi:hypothetical protein
LQCISWAILRRGSSIDLYVDSPALVGAADFDNKEPALLVAP